LARIRTVLVAGAGIGGLAAAISLAKGGLRPVLLERAAALEEIGAGIQLTPNATRALERLGALTEARKRAVQAEALFVGGVESGVELARVPLGETATARFGAPWLLILRADLQRALQAVADDLVDIAFEFGSEVVDVANHARGITALTERAGKGTEHLGLALIGADGLWSRVRARMHGDEPPVFHDLVAWRALVRASDLPVACREPVVRLWLGRDAHLVHYPVGSGESVNVVAVFKDAWREAGWNAPADTARLPKTCERFAEMPRRVLAAAKEFRRWALADRPPLAQWGNGRATLLGDAAHPMLPFLAQGAAAALEDAVALGRHLKHPVEAADALRAYEDERSPRAARLQRAARLTGRAYHLGGPARALRDFMLRWYGDRLTERHAWIYRYGAPTGAGPAASRSRT
jgi:salicylate hydroxylase